MRRRTRIIGGIAGLALAVAIGWACAGPIETPEWDLAKSGYDPYGSAALLSPANDTRANLLLLLADRQGLPLAVDAAARGARPPLVMMPWAVMKGQASPTPDTADDVTEGTRCQTLAGGNAAFAAALGASRASAADKAALTAARAALKTDCTSGSPTPAPLRTGSPVGQDFSNYLGAAADFYAGRFANANMVFAKLGGSDDPWLRETARYMMARNALNQALERSLGDYGELVDPPRRDIAGARAAGAAFAAYLTSYPAGRYAASARGLMRRGHWLAGDRDALAGDYGAVLAQSRGAAGTIALIDEFDAKLGTDTPGALTASPLLIAVQDLQRMRAVRIKGVMKDQDESPAQIGADELLAQRGLFRDDPALFAYLRAALAYWVRHDPRGVLALIPDAAHRPRFTYLEFSRQVLRGLALDAVHDRNARGFWLSLLPGAVQPYQHGAIELALATHDQLGGHPEAVFSPGSPVTHPVMRDLLLEFDAGPALLRQQARAGQSDHERRVALYILLAKELQRGFYAPFVADSAVIPAGGPAEGPYWGAQYYNVTYSDQLGDPPLGVFASKPDPATRCAPIRDIARALAADPAAPRPTLCLAEFLRTQGFDNFEFDAPMEGVGLVRGRGQFPGVPFVRMAAYQRVLASPRATADDRAFALNRMVRCYAPSGYSSCGGEQVDKAVRKSWFDRLRRDYPASPWSRDLRYYW